MAEQGVVLDIDAKFLENLQKADKALQNAAKQADNLTNAFSKTLSGSGGFAQQMQSIYAGLAKIGGADFSTGVAKISSAARNSVDAVNLLTQNVSKLKDEYNALAQSNTGSRAKGTHMRITSDADMENIAKLRHAIAQIDKTLNNRKRKKALSLVDVQSLTEQRDLYKRAVSELTSTDSKRTKHVIDETNKRIREVQREAKAMQSALDARYTKSPSSALSYAKQAKSIDQMAQSIKYLETVRNRLNANTKSGAQNIDKINQKIEELKAKMRGVKGQVDNSRDSFSRIREELRNINNMSAKMSSVMTSIFSIQAIRAYINQIIQVRGEFELQQRALQALLQNKAEANKLWEQTVQLAVKSPFQVKELVTYTKQLAAYRVETEKLHDTTKMLADISAGLGVDMSRLILAFGQVKAANYLRGTELRQFSEAGINILDELARYYTTIEGKAVTVAEVFERVSKRMVSFADVEKVLQNVTSAGGMFYQMQEIQAETLKGSISNLKDQLDLMLNDIGKNNEGILKGAVQLAAFLIKNYNALIPVLTTVALAFAGMHLSTLKVQLGMKAIGRGGANLIKGLVNPWTLALAAVSEVISAIIRYNQEVSRITKEHNRLRDSLSEIELAFRDAMKKDAVDGMRNSFSQLVELAKNEFQIDLKLNDKELKSMDFSALEAKFVELRDTLFDSNAVAEKVKKGLASAKNWDNTFWRTLATSLTPAGLLGYEGGESMFTDIKQFEKAAQDVLVGIQSESKRIANELQLDTAHMLRLPQAPLETNLQYVNRLVKAYAGLRDEMEMKGIDTSEIDGYIEKLRKHTAEASRELGLFFAKYEEQIVHLSEEQQRAFINNIVDSEGWSEYTKELIYNLYNLDLERTIPQATAQFDLDNLDKDDKATASKDTRWQDLLRTIKEVNQAYKELEKTFDDVTAKEGTMTKYAEALNDVLSKVRINGQQMTSSSFMEMFDLTTEEGMLKALDIIAKEAPEAADKLKAKLEKGEIVWEAKIKTKEESDAELTQQMEDLFSGYELSLELDKLNIPKSFTQDFFNIEALSLPDLRSKVESLRPQFVGTDQEKEYQKYLDKIKEMEIKAQQERLKTYLQYARDAIGERAKIKLEELRKLQEIELTFEKDSTEKQRAVEKVQDDAKQALNKQDWEDFQKSSVFVSLFEDLDTASDALMQHAIEKLQEFQNQWQDMPYEEMRDIVDKISKLRTHLAENNPFGAQFQEAKARVKADGRSLGDIEQENVGHEAEIASSTEYIAELETILRLREEHKTQEEYIASLSLKNVDIIGMETDDIRAALTAEKERVNTAKENLANNKASIEDQKVLKAYYLSQADAIQKGQEMANDLYDAFSELMDVLGGSDSIGAIFAQMGMDMANSVLNCFALQLQLKATTVEAHTFGAAMNAAMGIIGWIVMAVQLVGAGLKAVFAAKDKRLEKQIESLTDSVEILDKELSKIEEKLDKAFSATHLAGYVTASQRNIDAQIDAYNRMIKLEQNKKNADEGRIKEWGEAIAELNQQRAEIYEEGFSTASSGILDDALSSAEAFVDAWYEAFQETGDGLSGLQDEFQDMLSNLIKRQAALQIVGSYTNLYRNELKKYLDPENGDVMMTAREATLWAEEINKTFPELNEALKAFYTSMEGALDTRGELSDLGKGVQGITETTAQAVEALLNSIRFYVADSNATVRRIDEYVSGGGEIDNPLLSELQTQTALIRSIESMFGSVIGHGSSAHSGAYLKVLM